MKGLVLTNIKFTNTPLIQRLICLLMLSFYAVGLAAQDANEYQVKKVNVDDFLLGNELIEAADNAIYLFNIGECNIEFFVGNNPSIRYKRKFRIRILNNSGLSHANVSIPLVIGVESSEKIISVNGGVYNLVDDEVAFDKLKNDGWLVQERSDESEVVKISFNNVKVGSIIELEYVITSPFIVRPRDWDFQVDGAPVFYSEYIFAHPQQMNFRLTQRDWLNVIQAPIVNNNALGVSPGTGRPNYKKRRYTFIAENVPGMHKEPIMNATDNYRSTIMTELEYLSYGQADKQFFFKDWHSAIDDFIANRHNAEFIDPNKKLGLYKSPHGETNDTLAIIADVYTHISKQYAQSNALNYLSATRSLKRMSEDSEATENEINWILVATLINNGVQAYPLLYSKRNYPVVREDVPIFTQFHDLMVIVKTEGDYLFLDASNPNLSMGEISEWSCNGNGFVLNKENPEWVTMKSQFETSQKCGVEFETFNDGVLSGKMNLSLSGVYANRMVKFLKETDIKGIGGILNFNDKVTVKHLEIPDLNSSQPLVLKFEIEYRPEKNGSTYILVPVIFDSQLKNPLKETERRYPVNYSTTWSESYTCLIRLNQEEYDVVLPESISYAFPNREGALMFSANYTLDNLLIRSKMEINKTTFMPNEYGVLRTLYEDVSASHSTFIEVIEK